MKITNSFSNISIIIIMNLINLCLSFRGCNSLNNNPFHRYVKDNLKAGLKDVIEDLKDLVALAIKKIERLEEKITFNNVSLGSKDCSAIQRFGYTQSGVYTITPNMCTEDISVYCDLETDGGGWTIFQRRLDGKENFYRGWKDYKHGFGNPSREYWLGNDYISLLTNQDKYELRIDLEDFDGNKAHANYKQFSISPENFKYKLMISGYSGDAGDSLSTENGMLFTTKDEDNDLYESNCAVVFKGAWWYRACHASNLNGQYVLGGNHTSYADGINWFLFKGYNYSLQRTEMKIRPVAN